MEKESVAAVGQKSSNAGSKGMFWMVTAAITATLLIIAGIMLYVVYAQHKLSERRALAKEQFIELDETGGVVKGIVENKRAEIESVVIPDGITTIGVKAFAGCKKLSSVKFPKTIRAIGHEAFADCPALKELDMPEGLNVIGSEAFRDCAYFQENALTIPASVKLVRDGAFAGICRVELRPDDPDFRKGANGEIIDIKDDKLVFVPPAVMQSGIYVVPEVKRIGGKAFFRGKFTGIKISSKVFYIGEKAFIDCTELQSVIVPGNVERIEAQAFEGCVKLESVVFENGVKTLGRELFKGCKSLKSVVLPASVSTIADGAFIGVGQITLDSGNKIFVAGGNGEIFNMINVFSDDKEKQKDRKLIYVPVAIKGEYIVPEKVRSIAGDAFNGCEGLTRVVIADDVAEIGAKAFSGCKNITEIEIPASLDDKNTPIEKRLEKLGLPKTCKITVRKK